MDCEFWENTSRSATSIISIRRWWEEAEVVVLPEECFAGEATVAPVVHVLDCSVSTDATGDFAALSSNNNCTHLCLFDLPQKNWSSVAKTIWAEMLQYLTSWAPKYKCYLGIVTWVRLWSVTFCFLVFYSQLGLGPGSQQSTLFLLYCLSVLPAEEIALICVARNVKVIIIWSEVRTVVSSPVLFITGVLRHLNISGSKLIKTGGKELSPLLCDEGTALASVRDHLEDSNKNYSRWLQTLTGRDILW